MPTKYSLVITKNLSLICAALLLLSLFRLPPVYYTALRIIVMLGAFGVILNRSMQRDYLWCIAFVIITVLFNPFFYWDILYSSQIFLFNGLVAVLFLIDYYTEYTCTSTTRKTEDKEYSRDRIY